jgi:hypothetical protein
MGYTAQTCRSAPHITTASVRMSRILASIGFLMVVALLFLVLGTEHEPSRASNVLLSPSATSGTISSTEHFRTEKLTDSGQTQCISGCSVREAGFGWAERNDVEREADCDPEGEAHNSADWVQGCRDYVRVNRH